MNPATYSSVSFGTGTILKYVCFLMFMALFSACSGDTDDLEITEEEVINENNLAQKEDRKLSKFKGIFATNNTKYRGTFFLEVPKNIEDIFAGDPEAIGTLTLSTGENFDAEVSQIKQSEGITKNSDVLVQFDSEDFSFNFTVDENNQPVISDVVFKNQDGSIVASEETNSNTVTPVTGTYKCTNCQDQDSPLNGIILNNQERTFNMLLTTADGTTSIDIQALVVSLQETEVISQQKCTTNSDYTFCSYGSGINGTNDNLVWSGVHRYTSTGANGSSCATLAGNFALQYENFGSIEGEFKSDSSCPNKTYFISSTGVDSNTGLSPDDAWKSIEKLNEIQFQPGDQILFKGGEEFSGNLNLDSEDANNSANPVLISSYGEGRAKIKAGNDTGIYAYNTSGIKIDNLIIEGSGMHTNNSSGISFYNDLSGDVKLDYVEITNSEVYGFKEFGIVIGAYNGNSGYTNVLIENNKVHDCLDVGISSYGEFSSSKTGYAHSNITVRNCEVYNIEGYSKGKHSGNGILLSDVQNSVIEHCTVYNSGSGNTSCGGPVGIWYWDADQVTIQYSEVYNMSSGSGCDGGGFDLDGGVTNGVMQYNYSHDNDGAGFMAGQFTGSRPMKNIIIRYNISENDAATNGGSVYLFNGNNGTMSDIYVYNNTLYLSEKSSNQGSANIKYTPWKALKNNMNFYNNILFASNGADLINIPEGYDGYFAGNLYYSSSDFSIKYKGLTYTSLEDFRSTGNELHNGTDSGFEGDPLLNNPGNGETIGYGNNISNLNAYLLQSASPAKNAGIEISDSGSRDYFGNIISGSSDDIGAHQADTTIKSSEVALK
ncbi:right-handed parallel beta-helix repeat-containing protein [Gramella lutea]|uniref:Right-handed parallel beta-helix repeat-containing protein n=1 Tax=Christiangramia lutea TaxID=1607951 RepID=A0A9X2AA41_9FLAO|nr:right-handed parallel beta-helix repeat-containing protein [Christiangramia lutea]MCH4824005.1 right-handed parallel beta-helix repeat-containing protein [Christiangramia lutea]